MKQLKMTILSSSLLLAGTAIADCPSTLATDELKECIMVEGSGTDYQEWKQYYAQGQDVPSHEDDAWISMSVPDEDFARIAPAAGKPRQ